MVHVPDPPRRMTQTIDARGLLCPLPVLRLRQRLNAARPGMRVALVATDRAAAIDIPHFCTQHGHLLLSTRQTAPGETEYLVERGPDA